MGWALLVLMSFSGCGGDGTGQDSAELVRLVQERFHSMFWEKLHLDDKSYPVTGFTTLLQGDRQLVDEVFATLGSAPLLVIWRGGRAAPYQLPRDVASQPISW